MQLALGILIGLALAGAVALAYGLRVVRYWMKTAR